MSMPDPTTYGGRTEKNHGYYTTEGAQPPPPPAYTQSSSSGHQPYGVPPPSQQGSVGYSGQPPMTYGQQATTSNAQPAAGENASFYNSSGSNDPAKQHYGYAAPAAYPANGGPAYGMPPPPGQAYQSGYQASPQPGYGYGAPPPPPPQQQQQGKDHGLLYGVALGACLCCCLNKIC
ncbi:hypothetical protein BDF22DRAFT_743211 [Syncephalis plumigaleata]|nr:hypothetical protein BDF22DRAFT_743211 [Syncephalis plumigaleata]